VTHGEYPRKRTAGAPSREASASLGLRAPLGQTETYFLTITLKRIEPMTESHNFFRTASYGDTQDGFSAGSFLLMGDYEKRELAILPLTERSVFRVWEDVRRFEVSLPHRNNEIVDTPPEQHRYPQGLVLSIHSQFFEDTPLRCSSVEFEDVVPITDAVAAELVYGLLIGASKNQLGREAIYCAIVMLLDRIAGVRGQPRELRANRLHEWQICALDKVLRGVTGEETSVESVASRCRLSTCQFSRLFKGTYGMPFYKFLVRGRIERSKNQLASSDDPISQIALDCGFADQSCFTRRFTMMTGIPPASWRKRAKVAATPSLLSAKAAVGEQRVA
jgi:AraC-like DNA-binding protein